MTQHTLDWLSEQEVLDFLRSNEDQDPDRFLLSKALSAKGWDTPALVRQLKGRKTARYKFPTWYACEKVVYPVSVSLEQASSEATALFKASLVQGTLADLSGGMGIDTFFFSRTCSKVWYAEPREELCELSRHNFAVLGAGAIEVTCTTAEHFLERSVQHFDWLYIDPSRRKEGKRLADYRSWEPDIIGLKPLFWKSARHVMIKLSPMTDLTEVCKEIGEVREVYIVSDRNECKEVLLVLEEGYTSEPLRHAVLLGEQQRIFTFAAEEERQAAPAYSEPLDYLYEPDVALLKSGMFRLLALRTGTLKIHPHTHLYTSRALAEDFPGKKFHVHRLLPFSKKNALQLLEGSTDAHVLVRNATVGSEELKKQLKLVERGTMYLIVFKGADGGQWVVKAERLVSPGTGNVLL